MGQTFLWCASPLVFTAAARMAAPAIRPLGHGDLLLRGQNAYRAVRA